MADYRDPYSAFAGGLQGGVGTTMGLLQFKQQREQQQAALEEQAYEQDYKKFKTTTDFLESKIGKNLPDATKTGLYNNQIIPFFNKYSPEVPLQKIGSWKELTPDFMTKLKAIDEASDDRDFKINALNDLLAEADSAREEAAIKGKIQTLQNEQESGMLQQAAMIPGLAKQGVLSPEEAQAGQLTALAGAGAKGQEVLAGSLKQDDKDTATASLREFETVNGIRPEFRGTPQYKKMYEDWLKVKNPGAGSGQIVVMPTADGFAAINKRTGTATPIIGAGGESVNKPLTGEMITTQQQIGTVDDTFKRVKELYNPEFVGPVQGRTGAVRSATIGNPEDRATFYSALQDINNTLVYLKSGKQINEQEYERLKGAMPHRNLADSDFRARMIEFEKVFNSIITERQKNMGGYGKGSKPNLKQKYGLE